LSLRLPEIHEERLPNGAELVVARRPGVPLAAARLQVRAGSALDPAGRHGLALMVAAVARRGAAGRTGRAIDGLVESRGAQLSAQADEDAAVFALSAPVEELPALLGPLVDLARAPDLPAREFERLRRRELAALAHDADEPALVADRAVLREAYAGHPYGHATEGTVRGVSAMRRADAVAFHRERYGPAVATLVLSGPLDAGRALDAGRHLLSRWSGGAAPPPDWPAPAPGGRRVLVVDKPDATQTQVRLVGPGFPRGSPDYFPATVANAILGGGFTSRLVESIRVNRGLSYGIRSRFSMSRDAGFFSVSSATKNESVGELVGVALDEVARYREAGPSAEEVERATRYLAGLHPLSLETHEQWADRLADVRLYGYPLDDVRDYRERVRAVTAAEAHEAGRRWFPADALLAVAVGPARQVAPQLERLGPVRVVPVRRVL
jgi:zinc protease